MVVHDLVHTEIVSVIACVPDECAASRVLCCFFVNVFHNHKLGSRTCWQCLHEG